ncbi:MAG: hypothetical protein ACKERG_04275 [Candidatus Hodgkinia cicadicola]
MRYGNSESWGFSSTQAGLGRAIVRKQTSRSEGVERCTEVAKRKGRGRSGRVQRVREWRRGQVAECVSVCECVWDAWDWTELSMLKLMPWCVAMPH